MTRIRQQIQACHHVTTNTSIGAHVCARTLWFSDRRVTPVTPVTLVMDDLTAPAALSIDSAARRPGVSGRVPRQEGPTGPCRAMRMAHRPYGGWGSEFLCQPPPATAHVSFVQKIFSGRLGKKIKMCPVFSKLVTSAALESSMHRRGGSPP